MAFKRSGVRSSLSPPPTTRLDLSGRFFLPVGTTVKLYAEVFQVNVQVDVDLIIRTNLNAVNKIMVVGGYYVGYSYYQHTF